MSAYAVSARGLASRRVPQGVLTPMNALLFGAGEPGAWYDPADLSTLFQDTAGTTPVTAVEQAVALMLDKSGRGNHAIQATSTKRPVLSARVNLLTKTEQFDAAVWTSDKSAGATVEADNALAPNGTMTADTITFVGGADYLYYGIPNYPAVAGQSVVIRYHSKTTGRVMVFGGGTPPGTDAHSYVDIGGGWYLHTTIRTFSATNSELTLQILPSSFVVGAGSYQIWGASLTLLTDAHLPYQRVNTATDYDTAGFPYYLRYDGIDDAMQTGNINFTGTDKMTVWAGVTRLKQAQSIVCELSTTVTNNGMFALGISSGDFNSFISRGTGGDYPNAYSPLAPPPVSAVIGGAGSIGDRISTARANGVSINSNLNQGTGNYGNYPLYIGARAGTSLYFNGRLYGLIVRGAQSSLSQIEATEAYIKQKMRLP